MSRIFGYGEDAFTFWALKNKKYKILEKFNDKTPPSDCLVFYRPSFGRSGGEQSAEFGEFDAILVSSKNIYLIESKRDNFSKSKNDTLDLEPRQILRHSIFSWYLQHWSDKYSNNWKLFMKEQRDNFKKSNKKKFAPTDSLLAKNLDFVLTEISKHFRKIPTDQNIKNVLLFFYNKKHSFPPTIIPEEFNVVAIDYSPEIIGNFISLD